MSKCTGGIRVSFMQLLNWYGLHGKYITQTHLGEINEHAFLCMCNLGHTGIFTEELLRFEHNILHVCGYHRRPQTLAETCRNMSICFCFRAVAARVKYPGFMLLVITISTPLFMCYSVDHGDEIWSSRCCRKCKILACLMDHLWLKVGWSVSVLGSPPINNLLRPCNQ